MTWSVSILNMAFQGEHAAEAAYPADGVGSSSDRCPQSPGSRLPGLATSRLHGGPAIPITESDNPLRGIPGERTSNPQQNSSNLLFPPPITLLPEPPPGPGAGG